MAEYITTADAIVPLNGIIPFNRVSIPCTAGNVIPLAEGILNLRGSDGNKCNRFARYNVRLQANVQIPTGGAVTPIALGIAVNGAVIPESVAIVTPAAVAQYWHINTEHTVTVPAGCCVTITGVYIDGTADDVAVVPTPNVSVRRDASITFERRA